MWLVITSFMYCMLSMCLYMRKKNLNPAGSLVWNMSTKVLSKSDQVVALLRVWVQVSLGTEVNYSLRESDDQTGINKLFINGRTLHVHIYHCIWFHKQCITNCTMRTFLPCCKLIFHACFNLHHYATYYTYLEHVWNEASSA